ncbi:MAG: hypothetical protein VB087_08710 [Candidatus Limiplasma sp.]|nr:hypothetical protein [Candidatus Limiplasma sp.]MEA5145455.1 hypothetical protein [Candidatus Limiplasma sp.]
MPLDAVVMDRDLRRRGEGQGADPLKWIVLLLLTAFSLSMYLWEFANPYSDLHIHARIASEFNFADPHSITSRLAYPLWHLIVAALYQLGVPLNWAAAVVCAAAKGLAYLLMQRYIFVMLNGRVQRNIATGFALLLSIVTTIRIPGVNDWVYRGFGSPTVWHNPTQLAVIVTMLLCVPYLMHCWYTFERDLPAGGAKTMLPWRKVFVLAALLMLSLSAKPTFIQALIPGAALFFLWQWIRHPQNSRYFLQIILAFLPSVGYFMLQYLYYTGVVVPFTSGVEIGATLESVWEAIRNMAMMAAFPLFVAATTREKGAPKDPTLAMALLTVACAMLQAMFFRETGLRINHGNFNWASMSAALLLWVVVTPRFIQAVVDYRARRAAIAEQAKAGVLASADLAVAQRGLALRSAGFMVSFMLLVWHLYSSIYYILYLLGSGNAF